MKKRVSRSLSVAGFLLSVWLPVGGSFAADAIAPATENTLPPFQIEHSFVHTLVSLKLQRSYEIYIKLPPGYDKPENAQHRYPVVYLNDGPYTFQVASGETRVPFNHGTFEEFILVGLSYAQGEDGAISRERDLTPALDIRRKPYATGGARAYLGFLENEVMRLVEKTYRIDAQRRTLAGQSYGGLFGLWVMLNEPELFQNYILTSTSLWYNNRTMFEQETTYARHHTDLKANVYFAIGQMEHPAPCGRLKSECSDFDMVADQAAMVKQLHSHNYKNLQLHTKVIPGAYHTTTFPSGLLWALQELFLTQRESAK